MRGKVGSMRISDCQAGPSPADTQDRSTTANAPLGRRVDRQAAGQAESADMRDGMLAAS